MKRFYECTFIVNPGLDDAQIESTVKMAEDTITKNGGEIVNIEHVGRRRLAYPISKKHNGFYVSIEFESEGRIIEKVERFLTLDENVMRFLTVHLDPRELDAKRNRIALAAQDRGKDQNGRSPKEEKKEEKKEAAPQTESKDAEKKEEAKADEEKKDEEKKD
ncbi:MAG: 30S ribosomal protein S6 [Ignavibacteria bacterium]|nr:MAG: 30S ribosomal protein S6 [Ignavibacteria bacterium]